MKIKLSCLACGHSMELGEAYEDYQGEIRCWGCRAVADVTLRQGKLQSMKLCAGGEVPGLVADHS